MRRHVRSSVLGLLLVAVALLALGCTPGGSGATTPPAGSVAPAATTAPASPNGSGKGYGY